MPSLFTKGHQSSPKLQVFFYQLFNSRNTIKSTKKIILRIFVWSIQKNDVSLHLQTKK